MYVTRHDPKIYPHTKFRFPTYNYIQICSELDLAKTETRGQGHSDLETVGDSPGSMMYLVCLFVWFLTTHQPLWVISVRRYKTKHDEDGKVKIYKIK